MYSRFKHPPLPMQITRRCCSSCITTRRLPEIPSTCVSTCPFLLAPAEPWPCSATTSSMWPTRGPPVLRTRGTPARFTPVSFWICRVEPCPTITGWSAEAEGRNVGSQNRFRVLSVKLGVHWMLVIILSWRQGPAAFNSSDRRHELSNKEVGKGND